ncbi:hypothetical protein L3V82_05125 [Thiotrichales bacterium 19S3-7]|nr:hypothetical protein [Thiotrichales bacterium 19S3-7]MCF6801474.1 hypothetical protein [Thiotrichales bacterium 19S3-11]
MAFSVSNFNSSMKEIYNKLGTKASFLQMFNIKNHDSGRTLSNVLSGNYQKIIPKDTKPHSNTTINTSFKSFQNILIDTNSFHHVASEIKKLRTQINPSEQYDAVDRLFQLIITTEKASKATSNINFYKRLKLNSLRSDIINDIKFHNEATGLTPNGPLMESKFIANFTKFKHIVSSTYGCGTDIASSHQAVKNDINALEDAAVKDDIDTKFPFFSKSSFTSRIYSPSHQITR